MLFDVLYLREAGWLLPRFRSCMQRPERGHLEVLDTQDASLHRATRVARLLHPTTKQPIESIRPLHDAVLLSVRSDYMTITGIERVFDPFAQREFHYAQTWLLTPPAPSGEDPSSPRG